MSIDERGRAEEDMTTCAMWSGEGRMGGGGGYGEGGRGEED